MTDGPPPGAPSDSPVPLPDEPTDSALYWPAGARYPDEELIDTTCGSCGQLWRAHRDLAGSALACRCGASVQFALPPTPIEDHFMAYEGRRRGFGDMDAEPGELPDDLSTSLELEPGALVGMNASDTLKSRWTTRTLLELTAIMFAFLGPALAVFLFTHGEMTVMLEPLASVVGALLVLLIGATARRYTFSGVRGTSPIYFVEATVVAFAAAGLAVGFVYAISQMDDSIEIGAFQEYRDLLGVAMTLFVMAFCPAVFEELAFRGLLQGRMTALFGNWTGIFITAVVFALAHGAPSLTMIFQFGLGVYLGWLRHRCNSLVPGMLLHFLYNGTIVVAL